MPVGKHTNPTIKLEIINKIRNEGLSVIDASDQYDVNAKTIYRWLKEGVMNSDRNLILENNRLKKELEQAYRLLGRATAEMQKSKN
jgi:transposase-like protein